MPHPRRGARGHAPAPRRTHRVTLRQTTMGNRARPIPCNNSIPSAFGPPFITSADEDHLPIAQFLRWMLEEEDCPCHLIASYLGHSRSISNGLDLSHETLEASVLMEIGELRAAHGKHAMVVSRCIHCERFVVLHAQIPSNRPRQDPAERMHGQISPCRQTRRARRARPASPAVAHR